MSSEKPDIKLGLDEALRNAICYLNEDWPLTALALKKHDPHAQAVWFPIVADISHSRVLLASIDEIADGYRAVMMEKARLKLDILQLERKSPGRVKRLFSVQAKSAFKEINVAKEPLEVQFDQKQRELCRMNRLNFERLVGEVEASYSDELRERLGDNLAPQARKDAYLILGNIIGGTVRIFNQAFCRYGVDEFGIPNNILDPRQGK